VSRCSLVCQPRVVKRSMRCWRTCLFASLPDGRGPKSVSVLASARVWRPSKSAQIFSLRDGVTLGLEAFAWFGSACRFGGAAAVGVSLGLQLGTMKNRLKNQTASSAERTLGFLF